ncbi:MAG TPA: hypothetical protein VF746_12145 [Longimicrobium sp.]
MTDIELIALGRRLYESHCVRPARAGAVLTHDGAPVFIYPDDFDHAFFTAATRSRRGIAKDVVDPERIARARWIAPIVGGLVPGTKCYRVCEWGSFRKPPPEKRLYVVRDERYVIWLLPRGRGGFRFKTAYVTGHGDIERYIARQRLIWERRREESP